MSHAKTELSERAQRAVFPAQLPLSWTATAAGRGSVACRESRGIAVAQSRSGGVALRLPLGIRYLTLYAFSVENWNRPKAEVDTLMKFLAHYLKTEQGEMNQNKVRLRAIGQLDRLPGNFFRGQLDATIASLDHNTGTTLTLPSATADAPSWWTQPVPLLPRRRPANWPRRT
ncbi:MAG: hypothetical protein CM1200mP29_08980 [Verrucomicrobiota bacterium]|nr:MAG: hypothetical protein CM1200mP29_08980 [Verrucomicrobiota bacterium]